MDKNTSSSSPKTSQSAVNSEAVFHYEKYDYPGRYKKDEQGKPLPDTANPVACILMHD